MNIIQNKEGWWGIEQDDHVWVWICQSGRLDHDRHLHAIIEEIVKPGWVCIDAGALYGDSTLPMARSCGESGACIAVEANRMAYDCLCKNAEKFQSPVFCMNLALGEEHGGDAIHIMSENVGASKVTDKAPADVPDNLPNNRLETIVKTASIDGIVNDANLTRCDFIKIDCEGYEFKILKGAKATLKKFKPIMLIEMNSFALSLQGSDYKMVYDYLLELGYEWRIVQPESKGGDPIYDILCWPKNKPTLYKAEKIIS